MGNNIQVGIELLVLGLGMVFLVLFILMIIMWVLSYLVNRVSVNQAQSVSTDECTQEEIAAIAAVLQRIAPEKKISVVKLKAIKETN
jgi:sodium pump decarboxylase gamma subunit